MLHSSALTHACLIPSKHQFFLKVVICINDASLCSGFRNCRLAQLQPLLWNATDLPLLRSQPVHLQAMTIVRLIQSASQIQQLNLAIHSHQLVQVFLERV